MEVLNDIQSVSLSSVELHVYISAETNFVEIMDCIVPNLQSTYSTSEYTHNDMKRKMAG